MHERDFASVSAGKGIGASADASGILPSPIAMAAGKQSTEKKALSFPPPKPLIPPESHTSRALSFLHQNSHSRRFRLVGNHKSSLANPPYRRLATPSHPYLRHLKRYQHGQKISTATQLPTTYQPQHLMILDVAHPHQSSVRRVALLLACELWTL